MRTVPCKMVGRLAYVHVDVLPALDDDLASLVVEAVQIAQLKRWEHFNLVRLVPRVISTVTFLNLSVNNEVK